MTAPGRARREAILLKFVSKQKKLDRYIYEKKYFRKFPCFLYHVPKKKFCHCLSVQNYLLNKNCNISEGTDEVTAEVMAELSYNTQPNIIHINISKDDFQNYWKKQRENTSSSMSNLHFGHYKTVASSDLLSKIHAVTTQLPFKHGYSLRRWRNCLSCMLKKKQGITRVDKMRAILLLEADFNAGNKIIFEKRLMNHIYDHNLIPGEQFSIKGHKANGAVVNRRLFF